MKLTTSKLRKAGAMLVAGTVGAVALIAVPSPAFADDWQVIERSGCNWKITWSKTAASTKRASPNDCAGHGWVRIQLNGASGYTAWTHSADVFDGAVQRAPAGRWIVHSQHTTCSATCAVVTKTP